MEEEKVREVTREAINRQYPTRKRGGPEYCLENTGEGLPQWEELRCAVEPAKKLGQETKNCTTTQAERKKAIQTKTGY